MQLQCVVGPIASRDLPGFAHANKGAVWTHCRGLNNIAWSRIPHVIILHYMHHIVPQHSIGNL